MNALLNTPKLHARNLAFGRGDWQLCRGWNQAWQPGMHLLIGGDGAGKTSLLSLLAGALQPEHGSIHWEGAAAQDVFWSDPRQPPAGTVPEQRSELWVDSLRSAYPRWDESRWSSLAACWNLEEALHKPWLALSAGTARKLRMAAALSSGAQRIMLDEPIAGLDKPSIQVLRAALQMAQVNAGAVPQWIFVAHYDDLQLAIWDSVLELEQLPV